MLQIYLAVIGTILCIQFTIFIVSLKNQSKKIEKYNKKVDKENKDWKDEMRFRLGVWQWSVIYKWYLVYWNWLADMEWKMKSIDKWNTRWFLKVED